MTEPTDEKAAEAFWPAWERVSDVFLYLCSNKIKPVVILIEHIRNLLVYVNLYETQRYTSTLGSNGQVT